MAIDLQELRDISIVSFCIAGTVLFLVAIIFTVVIGWAAKSTVSKVKGVVSDSVQPTLESVRETTENVQSTVAFVSDYAVTPVVRTYGIIAGARRFMVVVSRFRHRSEE
jgi:SNF family Na+-dependent transporter